jgi:hypothetical protein
MNDPPGFRRVATPAAILVVADRFHGEALGLELTRPGRLEDWRASGSVVQGGRTASVRVALPRSGTAVHLRPLAHGGWLRRFTGRRFSRIDRALHEMAAASGLFQKNAPVAEPVLVLARRRGLFWQIEVGTCFVEPSVALDASDSKVAHAAGLAVRRFHDAGGSHADLHIGNLIVDPNEVDAVTIVDLDQSRLLPVLTPAQRMRELMRLARSLQKRHASDAEAFWEAFFDGYTSGDEALRTALQAHMRRAGIRNTIHALCYERR